MNSAFSKETTDSNDIIIHALDMEIDWTKLANQLNISKLFRGFGFTAEKIEQLCSDKKSGITLEYVPNNYTLIEEGQTNSRDIFMLVNGQAHVIVQNQIVAILDKPTDLFGENGYLNPDTGRIATVRTFHEVADTVHLILRIKSSFIEEYLAKDPESRSRFYKHMGLEMTKKLQQMNHSLLEIGKHQSCKTHIDAILDFFRRETAIKKTNKIQHEFRDTKAGEKINPYKRLHKNCLLFENIETLSLLEFDNRPENIIEHFILGTIEPNIPEVIRPRFLKLNKKELVFSRESSEFGIILLGEVEIENAGEDGNPGIINRLGADDIIGEVKALNLEIQRTAIVRAKTDNTIVVLFSPTYLNALTNIDLLALIYEKLLRSIGEKINLMNRIWKMMFEASSTLQDCPAIRSDIATQIHSLL